MAHLHLTVVADDKISVIEVEPSETVENVKAILEVETGIPLDQQILMFKGRTLPNDGTLDKVGVSQNDLIELIRGSANQPNPNSHGGELRGKASEFVNYVRANPHLLEQLKQINLPLAQAVEAQNLEKVQRLLQEEEERKTQREAEHRRRIDLLNQDPLNPETQRLIAEEIRLQNIEENMQHALEHTPESFTKVTMLYVDMKVNGTPVKAFVDSGAQTTIMSMACAQRCGIERLIDKRYRGVAKGVGQAPILGRVHLAQIQIGTSFFPSSFTILQDDSVEFLLGLDMLRRHQCTIDLNRNCLIIGSESVPFLPEKDIPKNDFFTGSQVTTNDSDLENNQESFSEMVIQQLMGLGFPRGKVLEALKLCKGNAELAASYLFSNL